MKSQSRYCLCILLLVCSVGSVLAVSSSQRTLRGHVPLAVSQIPAVGRLPADARLDLVIGLPLRDPAGLTNLLEQLYDPASPNFRRYLTPEEFDQRFSPTEQDYQRVLTFTQTNGFSITGRHPNHALLGVNASVADIERAFQVTLRIYQHPTEARAFYAPDVEPSVEASVPILDVSGLSNFQRPHPKNLKGRPIRQAANPRAKEGSGPGGMFMGNDFRAAYLPGVSLSGSGQIVGLLEFDGYYAADITDYASQAGLPNVPLLNVLLDGFNGVPTGGPNSGNSEVALDIEMAVSMAPALSQIIVYEAGPNGIPNDILNAMATNTAMRQISCSWDFGSNPSAATDQLFQRFAAQGQSFFNASGDSGAYSGAIPSPDDNPYITLVGGTSLATGGPGGSWLAETTWNATGGQASAGGISTTYALPAWQQGISTSANGGSSTHRNVPDVAMVADNIFIVADNGQQEGTGGTSAAAPLWAAFTALANQQAAAQGLPAVGFINRAVYALGKGLGAAACFNDITTGNNTNANPRQFFATSGFDLCTGWGTPTGVSLLLALANPDALLVNPGTSFVANGPAGGPFNISEQSFTLTNLGANPLSWSVGNTSAWLTPSTSAGTLALGGPAANVTVSLAAAGSLAPGIYTSSVWFTNLTSGVAQNRQFTLLVGQELVQNGGFEVGDLSWWNLAGSDAAAYSFVDDGTISTISNPHSGTYFAALGQSNSVAYLSQSLPTLPGQTYLLSLWLNSPAGNNFPNQFLVEWNANNATPKMIFNQSDLGAFDWMNLQFVVTASSSNTSLVFGFRNDPDYFGLDDVSVVPLPTPQLQGLTVSGGTLSFSWNALPGQVYQVQYRTDLTQGTWLNLGGPITATDNLVAASDTIGPDLARFYRVVFSP